LAKGINYQLLISETIFEDSRKRRKNLNIAWIDYEKTFDSVARIEKSIELMGVSNKMEKWRTQLQLKKKHSIKICHDKQRNIS
jgi:hypothetical protein